MSETCDLCHEYDDCIHPVGIMSKSFAHRHGVEVDSDIHDKLVSLEWGLALERWNGETDPLTGEPDYFSGWSVYLCHDCFDKNKDYIQTWG